MKPSLFSCWYPFRSPEVRDIHANLTPEEIYRLNVGTFAEGALHVIILTAGIYFLLSLVPPQWGFTAHIALMYASGLLFSLMAEAHMRKKAKKLLCSSAYAREKGYTPQDLRLYSFRLW
ncbi:MAG: hypothetical protein NTV80_23310 [Verrucomicrobia bacterium]|nr:hypothetical protein [Verrucomicrobiota bacterium]